MMAVNDSELATTTLDLTTTTRATTTKRSALEAIIKDCAQTLGYQELKQEQMAAVASFVEGNDVFITLPTGYGKSLCYYLLPSIFDTLYHRTSTWSIIIVVSPLTGLRSSP